MRRKRTSEEVQAILKYLVTQPFVDVFLTRQQHARKVGKVYDWLKNEEQEEDN